MPVGEFYEKSSLRHFNKNKVVIETAHEYLVRLNRDIKAGKTWMKSK
jgi:hypothetical protein